MFAFGLDLPLSAAALVLLLVNVATVFPLWPGNVGLVQAVVALPLVSYGVAYATGIAFGIGLQVVEMSVGIGLGLLFLMREGLSLATLRQMPADAPEDELTPPEEAPARARGTG
jgi:glycosyltransferase 2 family protein